MLAVTVIKNTVTKRLWNFQIHFLPYSNAFEKKFFFANMFFYHFLQLCPRGHISKMLALTVIKNTVTKRLWNFQIHFPPYSNAFEKQIFFSNMFFYHFLQLCPRGHISKMLAVTVIKNTVTKRLWNFQIHFLPYSNAFEKKIFFANMFFYHFLQLCPRGHISKMLALTVIKNTVTKRLWNFQIHFPPYSNAFEKQIFFSNMFFYHFLQLCPRGHISKMLAVTVIENTVNKRLWNFQIRFLPYSNALEKKFFFQTCSFIIFFNFVPEVKSRKCLL